MNSQSFIYGRHAVQEFLKVYPQHADILYLADKAKLKGIELPHNIKQHYLSTSELNRQFKLKDYESAQGIVLTLKKDLDEILVKGPEELIIQSSEEERDLILLPQVYDQHNLGAITRSVAAFQGISGLMIAEKGSASLNRVVGKVSAGMAFHLKYAKYKSIKNQVQILKDHGYQIIALQKNQAALPLQSFEREKGRLYAFLFGSEDKGIPESIQGLINQSLYIPHDQIAESLNLSVAVGIAMYHLYK